MRIVVVDLEATCWVHEEHPALAANQRNECETIEIGGVSAEAPAPFRGLIRPRRHPQLSAFCTQLTGITQAEVDAAPSFAETYAAFLDWAGGDEHLVLASWGAFDDDQLRRDCRRHGLAAPRWTRLNIKRQFTKRAGRMSLSGALECLGLTFEGTPHRAVDDAHNAARVLDWLEGQASG